MREKDMGKNFIVHPRGLKGEGPYIVMSLRAEKRLQEEYDQLSGKSGRSRNELMCKALQYALENLEFIEEESQAQ